MDTEYKVTTLTPIIGQSAPPAQDGAPTTSAPAPGTQGAPGVQGQPQPNPMQPIIMMVLMMVVFYFILIRPQQKKMKEHQNLLTTLGKGDKIVTTGGLIGTIINIKGENVSIRSSEAKLEIRKSNVAEVLEKSSQTAASTPADES